MRHRNPISTSYFSFHRGERVTVPYLAKNWNFSRASQNRRYVQVVKWIAEHPQCTRKEVQLGVWNTKGRGYQSSLFATLLYKDFIDYDKKFKYTVTERGKSLLKKAGIKEIYVRVIL